MKCRFCWRIASYDKGCPPLPIWGRQSRTPGHRTGQDLCQSQPHGLLFLDPAPFGTRTPNPGVPQFDSETELKETQTKEWESNTKIKFRLGPNASESERKKRIGHSLPFLNHSLFTIHYPQQLCRLPVRSEHRTQNTEH